jgi:hypothetical protein
MSLAPVVLTVSLDTEFPPFERHGEPVSIGVAYPAGAVQRGDWWSLRGPGDEAVPVQVTTLDRWGDGSVRWMLVEFQADVVPGAESQYLLSPAALPAPPVPSIAIEHAGEVVTIRTGAASFDVPRSGAAFLADARVQGGSLLRASGITAEDGGGTRYRFNTRRTTLHRAGPLSAVVRLDGGLHAAEGPAWLDATVTLQFFAGLGSVRAEVSVTNPRAARHRGGLWDLGDPGSVLIHDLSVTIAPNIDPQTDVWASLDRAEQMAPAGSSFSVYQDSSGGASWRHVNHVNRKGSVPATFRGFRARRHDRDVEGLRATPVVSVGGGASRISVTAPRFWELFPKSLKASAERCAIGLLPADSSGLHELQGGERTTFGFVVCFGRETVSAEPLAWARSPLRISADAESYRQAGVWAPIAAGSPLSHQAYEDLVNVAVDAESGFARRREVIDEYGWRNFGEIHADHESVAPADPLVSHYNNQYDAVAGLATRFVQTGDARWFAAMAELADHVADIDLYHTTRDRAAYNGGYFWHTQHYAPAGTATHRAYSRLAQSSGGGPSAEHNYTTGLLLHHFLTGSERSRAAVIQLADWVLDMDDGRKSRFRWIDRRDTGLASGTRSPDYHGPGRGAGNSINAVLDAHRLTGAPRYLQKADALIARCTHPDDDPGAFDLLDAENRWSYTVFLQALGKYLDHRAERGLVDDRYAYARAVLLKYATWMCGNERPYLDTPERLEFPTETWAAQDLRKAAVFEYAARHTDDEGAYACFVARADGFVDYALTALQQSPTARLARPLVLLLAYGFQRPMPGPAAPPPPAVFLDRTARAPFVPLRPRILRKLAWAGAGISAAALVVIAVLVS